MFSAPALYTREVNMPSIRYTHKIDLYVCQLIKQPAKNSSMNLNIPTFWFSQNENEK